MFFVNGEKLERRLQEMITVHKVWRKQSKNEAQYIIKVLKKEYENTFKENNTEGKSNGCNHQRGVDDDDDDGGGGGEEEKKGRV